MKNNFQSKSVPRGTRTIWRYLSALILLFTFAIGQMWGAITPKTISDSDGEVYMVTPSTLYDYYNGGNGWVTNASGEAISSNSYYSSKSGSNNTNYIDPATETSGTKAQASGITLKTADNRSARFYFTGAVKATAFIAATGSSRSATITIYKVSDDSEVDHTTGTKYTASGPYEKLEVTGLTASESYYAKVTATNDLCLYAVKFFASSTPATKYTVTFNNNGHGGDAPAAQEITSGGKATEPTAPSDEDYNFGGWWNKADYTAEGAVQWNFSTSTVTKDTTLYAKWTDKSVKSDDATLSAFSIDGYSFTETFVATTLDYIVNLPFYASAPETSAVTATKNDANATVGDVTYDSTNKKYSVTVTAEDNSTKKTYTITLNWAATPAASSSINIEQLVLDYGKGYDIGAALDAAHIAYVSKDALDSLTTANDRNEAFLGLKFKATDSKVTIIVPSNQILKVKFGSISGDANLKVSVNGSTAVAPTLVSKVYTLAASEGVKEVIFSQTGNKKTVVYKQIKINADIDAVQLPWLVTYDAGEHGTCATAKEVWWGTALTLPTVTPEEGWSFDGWKDDENNAATSPYTPTKNVTLTAQYTALASPFDLTALTYKIGEGAATNVGYVDGTFTYNIELPYKPSYDAITVAPTLKVGTSYLKGDEVLTVSSLPGAATFTVVEAGGANEKQYTVNFTKAPKDGICLIKGNVGNDTFVIDEEASLLSGTADKNNVQTESSTYDTKTGWKFNARPARLGITLSGAETFQAGDIVEVFVTTVANISGANDKMRIFDANEGTSAHLLVASEDDLVQGANRLVLPTTSTNSLYLHRTKDGDYDNFNPYVAYVAVYRAMNPVLTAITFDGVDADQDSEFAFSVTLPQGTNLGTMTVTPTIVWNGAGSAAPTAAWAWGDNTYRVTDKDGDYTDYTITLTEALAPSAAPTITTQPASAGYYEGATIAALEVVATGSGDLSYQWYLGSDEIDGATAATYTPTVTAIGSYVYHCVVTNTEAGHPATSLASDEATITISEDPAAIKLLNGSTVNHTNFITGVTADETVEFMGNTVNYAKFSGTVGGVNGVKDLTRVIAYNATTTQTKIKVSVHNNSTNARSCYVKGLVEGADAAVDLATISLTNKEDKISDWITFDNAANRTIYIFVSSDAGDVYFTQVKVIESGTDLKMAGEAGYSLNFDHGRFFGVKDATAHFEELDVEVRGSDCQPLNSSVVKLANSSIIFDVTAPVTLTVTTNNNKTYYVTKGSAGTDNETAKTGATEFSLTAGTWYITGGASNVEIKSIAFALPKCEAPVIDAQPVSKLTFGPTENLTTSVSAHVSEGSLSYQWYNAADDSEVSGATGATLTTTIEGTYYVIVTNTLADHSDNSVKSDEAALGYRVANDATLSALSYGDPATAIALVDNQFEYNVYLPEGTTDVPELSATATMHPYPTVTISDATEFVSYEATSTVTVKSEDETVTNTYTVIFHVAHSVASLVDVTENTTWDWTTITARADGSEIDVPSGTKKYGPSVTTEDGLVLANYVLGGDNWDKIEGNNGAYAIRSSTMQYYQGASLHIHTTKSGFLTIKGRNDGSNMTLKVQNAGRDIELGALPKDNFQDFIVFVEAGDVVMYNVPATAGKPMRIGKIEFTVKETPDYSRTVTNNIGTLCVDHNVPAGGALGATFYQIASINELYDFKIDFEEVLPGEELKAGQPYIFQSTTGRIDLYYGATVADAPVAVRGMIGSFVDAHVDIDESNKSDILYIANNKLWNCEDLVGSYLEVVANRAYIVMSDVPTYAEYTAAPQQNSAPRRRVTLGKDAAQGFENIENGDKPLKVMIDGTLYIIRGEKVFDATGRLVK